MNAVFTLDCIYSIHFINVILYYDYMNSFVFRDKKGYAYLYSVSKKRLILISELLYDILELYYQTGNFVLKSDWLMKYDNKLIKKAIDRFFFYKEFHFLDSLNIEMNENLNPNDINTSLVYIKQICFELTQKCNLSCTYCCYGNLYSHIGNDNKTEMNEEIAFSFIDILFNDLSSNKNVSFGKKIVVGFYGGEALLKIDLIKSIVNYINVKKNDISDIEFEFIMTTNGLLLYKYIDFFVDNNFSIMVSLDGNRKNSSYRVFENGKESFDLLMKNMRLIKEKYPSYFDQNISFNSVIHNRNNISDVVSFIYDEFHKIPQLSELSSDDIKNNRIDEYLEMHRDISINRQEINKIITDNEYLMLDKSFKYVPVFFYKLLGINLNDWCDFFYDINDASKPSMCYPFINKLFVSARGDLHLCEHIGYGYSLGYIDLKNNKIVSIPILLSQMYSENLSIIKNECSQCADLLTCETCVFQKRFNCRHLTIEEFSNKISNALEILREREMILSN